MTTKHSPIRQLRAQADKIAAILKAAERGEKINAQFAAKIEDARKKETFKAGIVMDDKVLTLEMPWTLIRETTEAALAEYIVRQMQEANDAAH